ncbi:MAG TPA: protein-export chaperone SecB, partial [Methyloceanibacter sp.]|nr:protein-export chaperone SecB [Methyloceanibacter sp.]
MAKKRTTEVEPKKGNGDGPPREPAEPAGAAPSTPGAARAASQAQLAVLAQYIKDLSFENPGAPQSLQGPGQNPQLKVSVNVNAEPRGEETYEVSLHLEVH